MDTLPTFIRLPDVARRLGISPQAIYKRIRQGKMPRTYKVTEKAVAFRLDEIQSYLARLNPDRPGLHQDG